jgi:dihydroxyacetone kinase-like predicted kinase
MKYQHSENTKTEETTEEKIPEKENAFIAVAYGSGIIKTLKEIGVDYIIEGGQTMNPSTDDILSSIEKVNAKNIYVFPNNKNIILAAEQAKELTDKNVIVIPTKSIPQSISAVLAFDEDASQEENEEEMIEVIGNVKTISTTAAVRNTTIDGMEISEGDILGLIDNKIDVTGKNDVDVLIECLDKCVDDESGLITVFMGEGNDDTEKIKEILEEKYEDLDISVHMGNQPVYTFIASVE